VRRRKSDNRTRSVHFLDWCPPGRGCHHPAMQKYNQYCPVARTSEILADRWTPLIVRELILGSRRFNEIERGLPGISRSLLASRLRGLEDAGVIERLPGAQPKVREYHLSDAGRDLKPVVDALGAWGVRWAFGEPRPEELDAGLLVWRMHQRIDRDLLPERRTVVEFEFTGPRGRRVWLVLEPREVSVCVTPPRFDADLVVHADLAFFFRMWMGHVDYDTASRCGAVIVDGSPALAKQLPRWLMWSPMARFVRERERVLAETSGACSPRDQREVRSRKVV
jgi:DNA-binding HxlR family transcriptional regulator